MDEVVQCYAVWKRQHIWILFSGLTFFLIFLIFPQEEGAGANKMQPSGHKASPASTAEAPPSAGRFTFQETKAPDSHIPTRKFFARENGNNLSYQRALDLIRDDTVFREAFLGVLRKATPSYRAYFFETPPTTSDVVREQEFEFVLAEAKALAGVPADLDSFSEYFDDCGKSTVVAFDNLGGDARLVAPCPPPPPGDNDDGVNKYAHLASFVREAPDAQVEEFLVKTAGEMISTLEKRPKRKVWLSTSGLGVYWLHVRMDSRPKYYTYAPYKKA